MEEIARYNGFTFVIRNWVDLTAKTLVLNLTPRFCDRVHTKWVLISTPVVVSLIPLSNQPVLNLTPRKIKLTLTGVENNTNLV